MDKKSDNPNVKGIKHMAFAVSDAENFTQRSAQFGLTYVDITVTGKGATEDKQRYAYLLF